MLLMLPPDTRAKSMDVAREDRAEILLGGGVVLLARVCVGSHVGKRGGSWCIRGKWHSLVQQWEHEVGTLETGRPALRRLWANNTLVSRHLCHSIKAQAHAHASSPAYLLYLQTNARPPPSPSSPSPFPPPPTSTQRASKKFPQSKF